MLLNGVTVEKLTNRKYREVWFYSWFKFFCFIDFVSSQAVWVPLSWGIVKTFFTFCLFYMLFLWATLFSTQPQSCLTFSWIELQMLLRCCLIHINTIILWHFSCLRGQISIHVYPCRTVSMSTTRSTYVVSIWSIFHFHLHFHYDQLYNFMNTDTLVPWLTF